MNLAKSEVCLTYLAGEGENFGKKKSLDFGWKIFSSKKCQVRHVSTFLQDFFRTGRPLKAIIKRVVVAVASTEVWPQNRQKMLQNKKCLNVRQKLGTWKFFDVFQCYLLSFSLFLTLTPFESLIESLLKCWTTFVFISMLKSQCLKVKLAMLFYTIITPWH